MSQEPDVKEFKQEGKKYKKVIYEFGGKIEKLEESTKTIKFSGNWSSTIEDFLDLSIKVNDEAYGMEEIVIPLKKLKYDNEVLKNLIKDYLSKKDLNVNVKIESLHMRTPFIFRSTLLSKWYKFQTNIEGIIKIEGRDKYKFLIKDRQSVPLNGSYNCTYEQLIN